MARAKTAPRVPAEAEARDELDEVASQLDRAQFERALGQVDEELIRKVLVPYKLIRSYCRVTVEGLDHIPAGPALLAANHTGWLGLDYSNTAISIHSGLGRVVRGVVHPLWFRNPKIGDVAARLGLSPVSKEVIVALLKLGKLVMIFPEAEHGAFKEVTEESKYTLLEFKRGFVRAAMAARAPIVPVAIVGGEEANPSLATLRLTDKLFRLPLPVPKNLLPYPVKWRISFLAPLSMKKYSEKDAANKTLVHEIANDVRQRIQDEVGVQLIKRGHKYF